MLGDFCRNAMRFVDRLRLSRFSSEVDAYVAPVLSDNELGDLQSLIAVEIPKPICEFLLSESAGVCIRYEVRIPFEPSADAVGLLGTEYAARISIRHYYGGPTICNSCLFRGWNCFESKIDDDYGETCFVFASMLNGDYLGLASTGGVSYWDHEIKSWTPISPSFSEFLEEWKKVFFLGPELNMIKQCLNSDTGMLDASVLDRCDQIKPLLDLL